MKIALGAKNKLSFIDGTYTPQSLNSPLYGGWKKADCMIFSWLLNSICKDISESFIYANSARDLWLEVEAHFGESNGPMIYQLQREINATIQGNAPITQYFSNLKKLWDELSYLESLPPYTCGVARIFSDFVESHKIMQFFMGLNEEFDNSKDQILLLDPLPSLSKVCSMVLKVEKQRMANMMKKNHIKMTALLSKTYGSSNRQTNDARGILQSRFGNGNGITQSYPASKGSIKRGNFQNFDGAPQHKDHLHCEHCGMTRHTMASCFKIHGYPDWYKALKTSRMP